MLQLLPQTNTLVPDTHCPQEAVRFINDYIDKYYCETMSIDISFMNVLDACYVSAMCSAKHYIKYPSGNINWKISSDLVREFNKNLELGNNSYVVD